MSSADDRGCVGVDRRACGRQRDDGARLGKRSERRPATFASTGNVNLGISSAAFGVALETSGKLLVGAGNTVLRLDANGQKDTTFAPPSDFTLGAGMALHPGGRVLVTGIDGGSYALVARGPSGTPLVKKTFPIASTATVTPRLVTILPDGRIVLAGYVRNSDSSFSMVLARCTSNLELDPAFASGAFAKVHLTAAKVEQPRDLAFQPDGKLVLAGNTGDGIVEVDRLEAAYLTAKTSAALVARFADDGTPPTFGTAGVFESTFGGDRAEAYAVALQPDGKLLVVGRRVAQGREEGFAARLTSTGTLDASIATNGVAIVPWAKGPLSLRSVTLEPGGTLLATGRAWSPTSGFDLALVRLGP